MLLGPRCLDILIYFKNVLWFRRSNLNNIPKMPSDLMKIITDNNGDVFFFAGTDSILLLTDNTQVNPEEYVILLISIAL